MAQIKMDVSEYEEMKKVAKLLEQALDREKNNAITIAALKQEKIDMLEKSKHKVLKTVKRETTEHILVRSDIRTTLKRLFDTMRGHSSHSSNKVTLAMGMDYYQSEADRIVDCFFDKTTSIAMGEEEVLEEIGIEQFKEELKDQMQDQVSSDIAKKLKEHEQLSKENENYRKEVRSLDKMLATQIELREKSDKEIEMFRKLRAGDKLRLAGYDDLKFYVMMKVGMFSYGDYKRTLTDIIEKVEMELKYSNNGK